MIETCTDGFFYHPDGAKLPSIVERIATGKVNPRLDDVFAVAVQETKDEKRANARRTNRLLARIDEINTELPRLERAQEALDDRLERQHRAIEIYQQTGEIDEELLTPKCVKLVGQEGQADTEAEFEAVSDTLPESWEVIDKRVDDEFIYVTLKRQRTIKVDHPSNRVKSKIRQVLDLFRGPAFDRQDRVQLWDWLGSLSPINPGAP
jgi:hypothetical protein